MEKTNKDIQLVSFTEIYLSRLTTVIFITIIITFLHRWQPEQCYIILCGRNKHVGDNTYTVFLRYPCRSISCQSVTGTARLWLTATAAFIGHLKTTSLIWQLNNTYWRPCMCVTPYVCKCVRVCMMYDLYLCWGEGFRSHTKLGLIISLQFLVEMFIKVLRRTKTRLSFYYFILNVCKSSQFFRPPMCRNVRAIKAFTTW